MHPYELSLVSGPDSIGEVIAELSSSELDSRLFAGQRCKLSIDTEISRRPAAPVAAQSLLNPFHVDSLHAFLSLQGSLREILGAQLAADRKQWRNTSAPIDVWGAIRIKSIDLRCRRKPAKALFERMVERVGEAKAREMFPSEGEETKSFFTVSIESRWDSEHLIRAEFRNGAFEAISHS